MSSEDSRHQEVSKLVPWYVNGTLDERETDAVRQHLSGCAACREDVERCRDLAVAVQTAPTPHWAPSPEHLAQLLDRIDALEATGSGGTGWRQRFGDWAAALAEIIWSSPRPVRWALATQSALVALLAAVVVWQVALPPGQPYRTLVGAGEVPGARRAQIRVVFADDATEHEVRELLGRIAGTMVGGPSSVGAYTISLPVSRPDQVRSALDILRADAKVRLAEPVVSQ